VTGHAASRVLVTGVNGQLGHALKASVDEWKPADAEIVFVGRDEMDLSRDDDVERVLSEISPRLIINAAAYTAVDKAESDADTAMAVNGNAPRLMAAYLKKRGGALVHVSTDYVFDGSATCPYVEDAPTNPLSVYGATKLAGEEAIRDSGVFHWILRTSWVYSASGANFLKTMMRLGETKDTISVVADQHGAPIDAKRLALFIAQMLHSSSDPLTNATVPIDIDTMIRRIAETTGTYHATAAGATTWHAYAQHVVAGLHARSSPGRWKLQPDAIAQTTSAAYVTPAKRPLYSLLDHGRFIQTFDIVPPPWQQDVDACLDELAGSRRDDG
jgi:dTDP-4-dehydrorhamnose reductase